MNGGEAEDWGLWQLNERISPKSQIEYWEKAWVPSHDRGQPRVLQLSVTIHDDKATIKCEVFPIAKHRDNSLRKIASLNREVSGLGTDHSYLLEQIQEVLEELAPLESSR